MRNTKRNYYDRKINLQGNAKSLFNAFKYFSGKTSSVDSKIHVDGFNNFFVQVGQSLATDIPCNFTTADVEANEKSFFFCPSDESEVYIVKEKLKNKTADGHDGVNKGWSSFVHQ